MDIDVRFRVAVPDGTSDEDIEEWLCFELGANGMMKGTNALKNTPLEADYMSVTWDGEDGW